MYRLILPPDILPSVDIQPLKKLNISEFDLKTFILSVAKSLASNISNYERINLIIDNLIQTLNDHNICITEIKLIIVNLLDLLFYNDDFVSLEHRLNIVENFKDKSNKDLVSVIDEISTEYNKTKEIIIDLTRYLDSLEKVYNDVNDEIGKRMKK